MILRGSKGAWAEVQGGMEPVCWQLQRPGRGSPGGAEPGPVTAVSCGLIPAEMRHTRASEQRPDPLANTERVLLAAVLRLGMEVMKAEAGAVVVRILQAAGERYFEKEIKRSDPAPGTSVELKGFVEESV